MKIMQFFSFGRKNNLLENKSRFEERKGTLQFAVVTHQSAEVTENIISIFTCNNSKLK